MSRKVPQQCDAFHFVFIVFTSVILAIIVNLLKVGYYIFLNSVNYLTIDMTGGNIMLRFTATQSGFLYARFRYNSRLCRGQIKIICVGA